MGKREKNIARSSMVTVRMSAELIGLIDNWCRAQRPQVTQPSRSAAIKHLVRRAIGRQRASE
jgi:hypothetical protein